MGFLSVLKLDEIAAILDLPVLDGREFSPPLALLFMLEVVTDIGDEFIIYEVIKFACWHLGPPFPVTPGCCGV